MYQVQITDKDAEQRLDKYLHRILPKAGSGFIHKMLRKKNITLNDKKADGSERIVKGDSITIYFSDETLAKFMGKHKQESDTEHAANYLSAYEKIQGIHILYENDHVLLVDKPVGVLSQKAEQKDVSLNEWLIGYLLTSGAVTEEDLAVFKPSVCNRLDRNTSGIVLCSKTLKGARMLGDVLKNRTLHKYYRLYVKGVVEDEHLIEGYLTKDEEHNQVYIEPVKTQAEAKSLDEIKSSYIKTGYRPIKAERDKTLLEVELFTGKTHQIRAHLASIGHPILGDPKYGDTTWNEEYRKRCHVRSQLLHAYKVVFPQLDEPFGDISGRTFVAELPEIFMRVSDDI